MKSYAAALGCAVFAFSFTGHALAKDKIIGVSWSNFQEERWKTDEAAIKAAVEAHGDKYISADAQSSAAKQLDDVESLISQGANALIVLAQDSSAIQPAIQKAVDEGIPVVGYDRLIENPNALYITFDNKEVGVLQAKAVFAVKPTGNYVFIKGDKGDPNADFLHEGQLEVLKGAIDAGKIKVVGETYTDSWKPDNAQKEMEQILTANNNKVDAVVAENDGMAGGVVAALAAQGLAGTVPVSGQDGDHAAINRVALGTQTGLGLEGCACARQGGRRTPLRAWPTARRWPTCRASCSGPAARRQSTMNSIFLKPVPITKDNLDVVIKAGWITKAEVCQGVKAGTVSVCN